MFLEGPYKASLDSNALETQIVSKDFTSSLSLTSEQLSDEPTEGSNASLRWISSKDELQILDAENNELSAEINAGGGRPEFQGAFMFKMEGEERATFFRVYSMTLVERKGEHNVTSPILVNLSTIYWIHKDEWNESSYVEDEKLEQSWIDNELVLMDSKISRSNGNKTCCSWF